MPDKGRSFKLPPAMEQPRLEAPQRILCCLGTGVSARPMAGIDMFAIQPNIHRNQKNCTLEINPPTPITLSANADESDLEPKEILNRYNLQTREPKKTRQAACVGVSRGTLQFVCVAKLLESMLFWLEKLYPGHMPKAGMHRGVRKGR